MTSCMHTMIVATTWLVGSTIPCTGTSTRGRMFSGRRRGIVEKTYHGVLDTDIAPKKDTPYYSTTIAYSVVQ